jgi:hypothetical protein
MPPRRAALALCTGAGAARYVAVWYLIPRDGTDQPITEVCLAGTGNPAG